jgi:hypothetical protein
MLTTLVLAALMQTAGGTPAGGDPALFLGISLIESGDAAAAVAELDEAVRRLAAARRFDMLGSAHLHLGAAYVLLGQDKAARASFREALHWSPDVRFPKGRMPEPVIAAFTEFLREMDVGGPPAEVVAGVWYEVPSGECCLEVGLPPGARQVVVDASGGGDFRSLAAAIRSQPAVWVLVRPGTYRESLVLDRPVVLIGDGPRESIVVEGGGAPAITMSSEFASVDGLTVRMAAGSSGPLAVDVPRGRLTLRRCDVGAGSKSGVGAREIGTVVLEDLVVHDASEAGILAFTGGTAVVQGGVVRGCRFGAHARGGTLEMRGTRVERSGINGILLEAGSRGALDAVDVSGSGESEVGVAGAEATMKGGRFHDGHRGIVVVERARLAMEDVEVSGHASTGIALATSGYASMRRGRVAKNEEIGILLDAGEAQIEDTRVEDNRISGLVVRLGGSATVRRSGIRGNRGYGVLVLGGGRATVEGSTLSRNRAGAFKTEGGGLLTRAENRE